MVLCSMSYGYEAPCAALACCRFCAATGELLAERKLLTSDEAAAFGRVFKLLGDDTRLRLLRAFERAGELSVQALAKMIEVPPQAVSNQLQSLLDRGILSA